MNRHIKKPDELMLYVFIMAFILIILFWLRPVKADPINEYLTHYVETEIALKRRDFVNSLLPYLSTYAIDKGVDPLLVVLIIQLESSWKPSAYNPGKGEIGLGQCHGVCAKGQNLKTPKGQIKATIDHLARGYRMCNGDILQVMTSYGIGTCKPEYKPSLRGKKQLIKKIKRKMKIRYKKYLKAKGESK